VTGKRWLSPDVSKNHYYSRGLNLELLARQLWKKMPDVYRQHATFYTDLYDSYVDVIPEKQHVRVTKNRPDEPYRTLQLHNATAGFPTGQGFIGLLEKIGQLYRGYPIFHMPLQPDQKSGSITCAALPNPF
jgi:hypothetical protein